MEDNTKDKSDPFGIRAFGETALVVTKAAVDGASAFLSRVCLPAAEEFGFLLRDQVRSWRMANLVRILHKAEQKLLASGGTADMHAHPRIVSHIMEEASWTTDDEIQSMWAGLLASSCNESGDDESNLYCVSLLSQLTSSQVKILNHICGGAHKYPTNSGSIGAAYFGMALDEMQRVSGVSDPVRLERELQHLSSLGLLTQEYFASYSVVANVTPSVLALHVYARCQGARGSLMEYFGLK